MAEPLATIDDLTDRIPGGVPAGSETRAEALLRDASEAVRKFTGQTFNTATSALANAKLRNGIVRLAQRPVTDVETVQDFDGNTLTFTWLGDDRVNVCPQVFDMWSMVPYRNTLAEVRVTYTHGYDDIPDDVISIVCNVVARALGRDPQDGGVTQESIEGYSYTVGSIGAAGAVGLLSDEQRALSVYARVGGMVRTGP